MSQWSEHGPGCSTTPVLRKLNKICQKTMSKLSLLCILLLVNKNVFEHYDQSLITNNFILMDWCK